MQSRLLSQFLILGELSLDGHLRPVHGCLPIALAAKNNGFRGVILPAENANEAAVVDGIEVYGFECLTDVIGFLNGTQSVEPTHVDVDELLSTYAFPSDMDFAEVRGQQEVRRAIEIAAAGGHNIIMIGPPGAGKSMMAKRIPTILPAMTLSEALETTKIYSVSGKLRKTVQQRINPTSHSDSGLTSLIVQRPFRSPHHTITDVTLVGGGNNRVDFGSFCRLGGGLGRLRPGAFAFLTRIPVTQCVTPPFRKSAFNPHTARLRSIKNPVHAEENAGRTDGTNQEVRHV